MLPDPYMPSYRYNDAAPVRRSTLVVLACLTLIGVTGSAVGLALTPPDSDLAQLSYLVLLGSPRPDSWRLRTCASDEGRQSSAVRWRARQWWRSPAEWFDE
jgi:hypothetical protein